MLDIKIEKIKARIKEFKTLRLSTTDFTTKSRYSDLECGLSEALKILEEEELGRTRPIVKGDDIMSVAEFNEECDIGMISDDDGRGYYVKDNLVYLDTNAFYNNVNNFTHVAWYNK